MDEEQHVVAAKQRGVDGEEVAGDCGLGVQELGPGHLGSVRGGVDAVVGEDLPHGGLGDRVAEPGEFALDAAVSPGRVLVGESNDQLTQLGAGRWPTDASGWRLGPVFGDSLAVPSQQRLGRDDPAVAELAGECCGDRAEQGPVVIGERGSRDLASQHGVLVA